METFFLPFPNANPRFSNEGEGLENRRQVHVFVYGLRELVKKAQEEARKNYTAPSNTTPTKDVKPYWLELKAKQDKQIKKLTRRSKKQRLPKKLKNQNYDGVDEFLQTYPLVYKQLNAHPPHNRIINPRNGKYVDWWSSGTLRRADGTFVKNGMYGKLVDELRRLL